MPFFLENPAFLDLAELGPYTRFTTRMSTQVDLHPRLSSASTILKSNL